MRASHSNIFSKSEFKRTSSLLKNSKQRISCPRFMMTLAEFKSKSIDDGDSEIYNSPIVCNKKPTAFGLYFESRPTEPNTSCETAGGIGSNGSPFNFAGKGDDRSNVNESFARETMLPYTTQTKSITDISRHNHQISISEVGENPFDIANSIEFETDIDSANVALQLKMRSAKSNRARV